MTELASVYISGGDIDWQEMYGQDNSYKRVSLPTYVFEKTRYWAGAKPTSSSIVTASNKSFIHPLIGQVLVESMTQDIYGNQMGPNSLWPMNEHRILGKFIAPGTVFIEMAYALTKRYFGDASVTIKGLTLFNAIETAEKNEYVDTQIIVSDKNEDSFKFSVLSKQENKWIVHAEGKASVTKNIEDFNEKLSDILLVCNQEIKVDTDINNNFAFGPRWSNISRKWKGNNEILLKLQLPDMF